MSGDDDAHGVIHRLVPDDQAERLLAGRPGPDDGDLAPVAQLFAALREPARPDELAGAEELFARVTAAARDAGPGARRPGRAGGTLARLVSGKVVALVAVTALGGGAAAASTGQLPDPVQRSVAAAFSHVGIDLPSPSPTPPAPERTPPDTSGPTAVPTASTAGPVADVTSRGTDATSPPTAPTSPSSAVTPTAPDATGGSTTIGTGPAPVTVWTGRCRAYEVADDTARRAGSEAFEDLAAAAAGVGLSVEAFCAQRGGVPRPDASSGENGARGSTPAATAPGRAERPDPDDTAPEATAPDRTGPAGSTPAATAPGRSDANPAAPPRPPTTPTTPERRRP